jgi:hypothetical protein
VPGADSAEHSTHDKHDYPAMSLREIFDQMMEMTPDAPGVLYEEASVGKIPGWWYKPVDALKEK